MNEVALDYNVGFQLCLASLVHFDYGVKDSGEILNFDRLGHKRLLHLI